MILRRTVALSLMLGAIALASVNRRGMAASDEAPTFNNQVVRIFQQNCQACHHPGDIAPFSLMTYRDTRPWARSIQEQVKLRLMPPWKPTEGCAEFDGARRLSDADIDTISRWVDAGAPEGNASDLPEPLAFSSDWTLGQPDAVLQPDGDYTVKPGDDIYRCYSLALPSAVRGDRFISAVEIKPGNRNIDHHVVIFIDPAGVSKRLDDNDPGPGYTSFGGPGFDNASVLGGWAPGARAHFEPSGTGWLLPAGARLVVQVHYHPRGFEETDRTQLGLYFAREPVRKQLGMFPIINEDFAIPAGNPHYKVAASFTIPAGIDTHAIGIFPHMHLLGREMAVEATSKDDPSRCLISISDWNFNWQGMYYFKEQVELKGGTRVNLTAYYDNSQGNPRNPNSPPKVVRWGEQTTDEMCIAFVEFTLDAENRSVSSPQVTGVTVEGDRLVVNGKGFSVGADILIDESRLTDTSANKKAKKAAKQVWSNEDWKRVAAAGKAVSIRVLNTDGARSAPVAFTR